MTIPHSLHRAAANLLDSQALIQDPAALRGATKPQLRRFDVMSLLPNGNISETRHTAPTLPLFEQAFTAFCRGSLVDTTQGPIAVEDLLPGDEIVDLNGEAQTLLWKGRTTILPTRPTARGQKRRLISFMPDSLGLAKPAACVVVGPAARLLRTPAHLRGDDTTEGLLTPVGEFMDGMNIVETAPPTPVEMFHLCLPQHSVIRVGGLPFETYHPGPDALKLVSHAIRTLYLNLFSHIESGADFGPLCHPRMEQPGTSNDKPPSMA
ncbi:hypothetical protein GFB49_05885 [Epibacterium sp. SM1979]|uniref:Hedgehog/Intein (Hint) domain-containing protein n=1 Tax=Tritonibacter litoralis TaxID=2662264 RepID=A0A843YGS9_9RHOB|nr:Hint domain-containing protein [Tritonibacter litoralis]MQQ07977.1 hypothetical protein [Tritonibacter litoralis]